MKKEFTIKALNKIKEIQKIYDSLYKLGVDILELDNAVGLLIESIAISYSKDETQCKKIVDDLSWWLYEDNEKVIYFKNKKSINLEKVEDFVKWLEKWYK